MIREGGAYFGIHLLVEGYHSLGNTRNNVEKRTRQIKKYKGT